MSDFANMKKPAIVITYTGDECGELSFNQKTGDIRIRKPVQVPLICGTLKELMDKLNADPDWSAEFKDIRR